LTVVEEAITILVVFGWVADMERNTIEEKQSDFFFLSVQIGSLIEFFW
jgi:hypothetical protein